MNGTVICRIFPIEIFLLIPETNVLRFFGVDKLIVYEDSVDGFVISCTYYVGQTWRVILDYYGILYFSYPERRWSVLRYLPIEKLIHGMSWMVKIIKWCGIKAVNKVCSLVEAISFPRCIRKLLVEYL
jgi:hypothetical protein